MPALTGVSGLVQMGRAPSPTGVAVGSQGHHRFKLTLTIEGLPDPASFGSYTTYVAWATTPLLRPMIKLGSVQNGRTELRSVEFNKFWVLVSAEASSDVEDRQGTLVLRGMSPSTRMIPHDPGLTAPLSVIPPPQRADSMPIDGRTDDGWSLPPMHPQVAMLPGLMGIRPNAKPFLPGRDLTTSVPFARPRELVRLEDGDTLELEAVFVRRRFKDQTFLMYGFNGQYPGPLIHLPEKATIVVNFTNSIDLPSSVHWHGVRLENRYDGVPGVTQDPVLPGESFEYHVYFRDPGIYWYHPHFREDIQQDLGLYGNMLVQPPSEDYYSPVNREEILMLDDILVDDAGLVPFGEESATHMLMGRFGNVFLVNGEPAYELSVSRNEVVRFFLTNVSNTRTFNLTFDGLRMKLVGSDLSKFEREAWVTNLVIAPAERYIVEIQFSETGSVTMTNRVQAINRVYGNFFAEVDTLGVVNVDASATGDDYAVPFNRLRENTQVQTEISRYRRHFERPVDHELSLFLRVSDLPDVVQQVMRLDSIYFNPVDWSGTMPVMNWATTDREVDWILRDPATGKENMAIDWEFKAGDVVKLRLVNERRAFHAMQHPIHIHGQRFLLIARDGVAADDLVWKDTMLLPVGSTADILLEVSNPGDWMLHCHIAEHIESGMMMVFKVRQ